MIISLHFGALCEPLIKQLNTQGYSLSEIEALRFQDIADSIIMLKLHGILPDSVVRTSEQKLMKMIANSDSIKKANE